MEFQIVLELYLRDLEARGLSYKTWRRYRDDLLLLQDFLKQQGHFYLESISAHSVHLFFQDLQKRDNTSRDGQLLSNSTIDGRKRSVLTFFHWCEKEGWMLPIRHLDDEREELALQMVG